MASQPEVLYRLQQLDLQILRHRKRLQEIAAALQDDSAIAQAQKRVDSAQSMLAPLRARARDLELDIQSNTQKMQNSDQRLYSGKVKNPKELQDLQNEVASLKKRNGELEDRLLETMIAVEEAESELAGCEESLSRARSKWEQQHGDLLAEQSALEADIESSKQKREQVTAEVASENLKLYNSMKAKKGNQPVAAMRGRTCAVCGLEQTRAIAQEVRRANRLVHCAGCERVLVEVRS